MRKIPKGGDVTSALLKRIIKLANEERAKPFSKQEEIPFTNNLQQLARDQATLWHRYRHIPARQIRQALLDFVRHNRRVRKARLNRRQRYVAQRIGYRQLLPHEGIELQAAYELVLKEDPGLRNPEAAIKNVLASLKNEKAGRPYQRVSEADFVTRVRKLFSDHGVMVRRPFVARDFSLYCCVFFMLRRLCTVRCGSRYCVVDAPGKLGLIS